MYRCLIRAYIMLLFPNLKINTLKRVLNNVLCLSFHKREKALKAKKVLGMATESKCFLFLSSNNEITSASSNCNLIKITAIKMKRFQNLESSFNHYSI